MAASDNLHDIQFDFHKGNPRAMHPYDRRHKIEASCSTCGESAGLLEWKPKSGEISDLVVFDPHKRRGIATQMWKEGHQWANNTRGVKPPRHSTHRTDEGDAWAHSVSRRVPKRSDGTYP